MVIWLCNCLVPATIDKSNIKDLSPVVIAGQSHRLDCVVYGVPTPKIVWFRNGSRLTLEDNQHIRVTQGGRYLEITMATVNDTAVYQCRVANEAGRDDVAYALKVHGVHCFVSRFAYLVCLTCICAAY